MAITGGIAAGNAWRADAGAPEGEGVEGARLARVARMEERCVHCGYCSVFCERRALVRSSQKDPVLLLEERCTGCGKCVGVCPYRALIVISPPRLLAIPGEGKEGEPHCPGIVTVGH